MSLWMKAGLTAVIAGCGGTAESPLNDTHPLQVQVFSDGKVDARGLLPGSAGGLVLVGNTEADSQGRSESWIARVDSRGRVTSRHTLSENVNNKLYAIHADGAGGWIVAGRAQGLEADFWVARVSGSGEKLWEFTDGGDAWDSVNAIVRSVDGMFFLSGMTLSSGRGGSDAWIAKIDIDGNLIWEITRGGEGTDVAQGLAATPDGGAVVCGHIDSENNGGSKAWAIALDSQGEILWDRTYGGGPNDVCFGIVATADKGFVLAGHSTVLGTDHTDAWVFKIDQNGDEVWSRIIPSEQSGLMHAVATTGAGSLLVAGEKGEDTWLMELDRQGTVLWDRVLAMEGRDGPVGVVQTSDGGLGAVGFTTYPDNRNWSAWVLLLEYQDE